jgi:hypothetical protein
MVFFCGFQLTHVLWAQKGMQVKLVENCVKKQANFAKNGRSYLRDVLWVSNEGGNALRDINFAL